MHFMTFSWHARASVRKKIRCKISACYINIPTMQLKTRIPRITEWNIIYMHSVSHLIQTPGDHGNLFLVKGVLIKVIQDYGQLRNKSHWNWNQIPIPVQIYLKWFITSWNKSEIWIWQSNKDTIHQNWVGVTNSKLPLPVQRGDNYSNQGDRFEITHALL